MAHEPRIDQALSEWTAAHDFADVLAALERAKVPAGPIYSMADIVDDEHYRARGMIERQTLADGTEVKLPSLAPKLVDSPGGTRWIGPELGAHNDEIYRGRLGMSEEDLASLARDGII